MADFGLISRADSEKLKCGNIKTIAETSTVINNVTVRQANFYTSTDTSVKACTVTMPKDFSAAKVKVRSRETTSGTITCGATTIPLNFNAFGNYEDEPDATALPKLGNYTITAGGMTETLDITEIVSDTKIIELRQNRGAPRSSEGKEGDNSWFTTRYYRYYSSIGGVHMNFSTGQFYYATASPDEFPLNCVRPCMLKSDGTVDYYLDPNDYTKKEDGTASDIANTSYDGNAMVEFKNIYVYTEYSTRAKCRIYYVTNYPKKTDDVGCFYVGMYEASGTTAKLRSLSGQTPAGNMTFVQQQTAAKANGDGWCLCTSAAREKIFNFLVAISQDSMGHTSNSNDCYDARAIFGNGICGKGVSAVQKTGLHNTDGMFWGSSTLKQPVKVFHLENFWGNVWERSPGRSYCMIIDLGKTYYKLISIPKLGYYGTDPFYNDVNRRIDDTHSIFETGYIRYYEGDYSKLGSNGAVNNYWCNYLYVTKPANVSVAYMLLAGGAYNSDKNYVGPLYSLFEKAHSEKNATYGCRLMYIPAQWR